jgi:hypothetical protein
MREVARVGRGLVLTGIVLAGLPGAVVAAALGPSTEVICGRGNVLDRLAQDVMRPLGAGHIDAAGGSLCVVPSTRAWFMAAAVLLASVLASILTVRKMPPGRTTRIREA